MDNVYLFSNDQREKSLLYFCYCLIGDILGELVEDHKKGSVKILREILSRLLETQDKVTVVVDDRYVDKIYRDCYYTHFAGKHFEYSRDCKRAFLFSGDCCQFIDKFDEKSLQENFIGCFVVKPLKVGAIGRTLINPKYLFDTSCDNNIFVRVSEYCVHLRGMKLIVRAFPYSMQDSETLTCAESTLLNIFDYYSNQYSDYKFMLPSEMFNVAKKNGYERILPSHGMSYTLISRIMLEFGFCPRLYMKEAIGNDEDMLRILSYYIESAIPVAIGLSKEDYYHSVACIGHGKNNIDNMMSKLYRVSVADADVDGDDRALFIADSANTIDKYVVMDDNLSPYSIYNSELSSGDLLSKKEVKLNGSKLVCLAVPLYKRMYLEASDARAICIELLKEKDISFEEQYNVKNSKKIGTKDNPIVMRLFLASSRSFKNGRILSFGKDDVYRAIYSVISFPQFVWVCELYDLEHYKEQKPIGEIVLDATSSVNTKPIDSIIMLNYPGGCLVKDYDNSNKNIMKLMNIENELDAGTNESTNQFLTFDCDEFNFKMYRNNLSDVNNLGVADVE